jgi:threonine/homoserine/homoserine lactone efflux protein
VIFITASGALAPGPLFFATISHGSQVGTRSGVLFSLAHTLVEFSLIMVFALGLVTIASEPFVKLIIGTLGGIVLIIFGLTQIRSILTSIEHTETKKPSSHHLFLIGMIFTGLNPYFILWWLTVGAQLIIISLEYASFLGVVFMYVCHVWMDYVWLISLSYFAKRGRNIIGSLWYRVLLSLFGIILVWFGLQFLLDVFSHIT